MDGLADSPVPVRTPILIQYRIFKGQPRLPTAARLQRSHGSPLQSAGPPLVASVTQGLRGPAVSNCPLLSGLVVFFLGCCVFGGDLIE